nr:unnamed protein product [Callosobruchus analis]
MLYDCGEYLEFDQILIPSTLESMLAARMKAAKMMRPNNKPIRKFKYLTSNMVRSGYSPNSEFACRYCGKRYKWKSTMRRHEEDECGDKEPKFMCPHCPYKAKQKGNLKVHIRKHHEENPNGSASSQT